MRLPLTRLDKIKNVLHGAQAVLVVLAIVMTIAVFATSGHTDGRTGWYFGLCFLTLPMLLYQTMVPAWSRTRKFANIYAFATLDTFLAIAWLSAWAAVTNYVVTGKGKGDVKDKSGCENFKFGSTTKCRLSEAGIVLGVLTMLLFIGTALISFKAVLEFQRTGVLPGAMGTESNYAGPLGGAKPIATGHHGEEEEAFDSNINLRHDWEVEEYDHDEYHDRYGGQSDGHHAGHGAERGYVPANVHDHGVLDDGHHHQYQTAPSYGNDPAYAGGYRSRSQLGEYSDDQDLTSHRPTSTGPGPLGSDTAYHSPAPNPGHTWAGRI